MLNNPTLPSFGFPILGGSLMALMMLRPQWFKWLSVVFSGYTILILYLTAWLASIGPFPSPTR
ncbi:MAG: hypothetical protein OEM45_01845 [Gammaproteobacteria bacterium]|nr:hypothetical protein [Gammaproteobacteria bacterium]